jgi:hypothetical protein
MDARIKTSSQIAARTNEVLPTQEHILDEVHDATHLVRDAVHNAIDDQIKKSMAALEVNSLKFIG